jgi:hypothetical protein
MRWSPLHRKQDKMTDSNEPEKRNPGQDLLDEETIIELTQVVTESSEAEPIIELTQVVTESVEADEPVIELTDIAVETAVEADASPEDSTENIIELTDVVQKRAGEEEEGGAETVLDEDPLYSAVSEETDLEPLSDDDLLDTLGVDLEAGIDPSPAPPAISTEDVEAAIERVVKKMLSEKIDTLLRKVIETEVSKEVDRIRNLLLDEAPDMDDL